MKQSIVCLCLIISFGFAGFTSFVSADEFSGSATSLTANDILPVGEAFRFGYTEEQGAFNVFWQVLPGYFLYRDKFQFVSGGQRLAVELAEGKMFDDETFGRVQVLEGFVEVSLPEAPVEVSVHYQGCAEQGFCYPPQKVVLFSSK